MNDRAVVIRQRHHGETHISTFSLTETENGDLRCQVCGAYLGALVGRRVDAPPIRQLVRIA